MPYWRHWAVINLDELGSHLHPNLQSGIRDRGETYIRNPWDSWKPALYNENPSTGNYGLEPGDRITWFDYTREVPPGWNGNFDIRIRTIEAEGLD